MPEGSPCKLRFLLKNTKLIANAIRLGATLGIPLLVAVGIQYLEELEAIVWTLDV